MLLAQLRHMPFIKPASVSANIWCLFCCLANC